jgi:hypothetical protein
LIVSPPPTNTTWLFCFSHLLRATFTKIAQHTRRHGHPIRVEVTSSFS